MCSLQTSGSELIFFTYIPRYLLRPIEFWLILYFPSMMYILLIYKYLTDIVYFIISGYANKENVFYCSFLV